MRSFNLIGKKLVLLAALTNLVCIFAGSDAALASLAPHQLAARSLPLSGKTIVVDPGHGGSDSGARQRGVREQDLTLSIGRKLKRNLEDKGAHVIMTRNSAKDVSLEERVNISNIIQPDVFVSVHINASGDGSHGLDGIETYYYDPKSKRLAQVVYNALVSGLDTHGNWVKQEEFYVVHHNQAPAVLAEVGYMTNRSKLRKLVSPAYQEKIASSLTTGVLWYFFGVPKPHKVTGASSVRHKHILPAGSRKHNHHRHVSESRRHTKHKSRK